MEQQSRRQYKAVLFDLGGVVLPSPFAAIARYAASRQPPVPTRAVNVLMGGHQSAFAKLEASAITFKEYCDQFEAECKKHGFDLHPRELIDAISTDIFANGPRPEMVAAIKKLRQLGFRVAAITNNWYDDVERIENPQTHPLAELFDVFVESRVERMRKPEIRIYQICCERLGVSPKDCVFLDDIGQNLKPAKELGMATIKVNDPIDALQQLESLLNVSLLSEKPTNKPIAKLLSLIHI
eukprot:TRINITY_DN2339_c0_g1_i2.p1 TRINITY_DN2339_c0_g1~~TRINITY_DN2339_c0_g1_i2.p1  ORF type:complete len:249 (+),score=59.93 TRINITY_DN2339_c0_g1_i2:31-747(+)